MPSIWTALLVLLYSRLSLSTPTGPLDGRVSLRTPRCQVNGGLDPVLLELSDVLPVHGVGDQPQQQPLEQGWAARDEKAPLRALVVQGDPRLPQEGVGLVHQVAAQPIQELGGTLRQMRTFLGEILAEVGPATGDAKEELSADAFGKSFHRLPGGGALPPQK